MKKLYFLLLCAFLSNALFSQINIQQGLVAYYPFNGNTKDSTSNGNDGSIVGTVSPVDNRLNMANSAYFFDGNNNYIDVPASSSIQPTSAVSVSAWLNTSDKTYWNYAVCKRLNHSTSPGESYLLATTLGNSSTWQWAVSSTTTEYNLVSSELVEDSVWLHLVGTFDGDTMMLFLNGQKIGTKVIPHTTLGYSNLSLRLGLGIVINTPPKAAWKGSMDEIRIYDRALTIDEIKYLYNPALLNTEAIAPINFDVKTYPNPANDVLFIDASAAKDMLDGATINITDISGKNVISTNYGANGVDISNLSDGVYFINIPAFNSTLKFIKSN
jgi:hypothetical protein